VIVAVTGATGFLGRAICCAFRDQGHRVIGVVRSDKKALPEGVERRVANLLDPAALSRALRGVDVLVSNAAMPSGGGDLQAMTAVNVDGVANQLRGCDAPQVVHISTLGVYRTGLRTHIGAGATRRDLVKRRRQISDLTTDWRYCRTKALGEEVLKQEDRPVAILRPGPIYGPQDHNTLPRLKRAARKRLVLLPKAWFPLVHVEDVAAAAVASVGQSGAWNLGAPETLGGVFRSLRQSGVPGGPVWELPFTVGVTVDTSAAERDLGFSPRPFVAH